MITPSLPTPSVQRVLLVDDDPMIHSLVGGILKSLNLAVVSAFSGDEGIARASEGNVELILLDNNMTGASSGLDVLRQLRGRPDLESIPVIMVTAEESNRVLTECFAAGALDYVRKPFASAELRARVSSVLERQRLLGELKKAARYDRLTGLANRATLTDRMAAALKRAHDDDSYGFAVMFLDFDRFKFVNDTLGHDVGDMLLQAISGRLLHNLRATESGERDGTETTVARLGGDEFVIILAGVTTNDEAEAVGLRLLAALDKPYHLAGNIVHSTASIGTVLSTRVYANGGEMLRDADTAMYEAKSRGKACQVVFGEAMRELVRDSAELELSLRAAVASEQLHVAFQPIFSLDSQAVVGLEAFARWTHPTRGNVAPAAFIPLAEQMGIINALSDNVMRQACATFMTVTNSNPHATRGIPEFVSINLSYQQLSDDGLIPYVVSVLAEHRMQPSQLQLEIAESMLVKHRPLTQEVVADLRALGIRVAMDNFGARESSLSCLQEFAIVSLKIDRALVANSARGRQFAALLHAVVTLADNLGFSVIAEGVETNDQLVLLQALGCQYAQGFFLAAPMNGEQLREFFNSDANAGLLNERSAA